jgi:hypothetical protein
MSRSQVASHNVYAMLNTVMRDDDSGVDDLDESHLAPSVPMATPTLDGNTDGCTTLALTDSDMFADRPTRPTSNRATNFPRFCNWQPP